MLKFCMGRCADGRTLSTLWQFLVSYTDPFSEGRQNHDFASIYPLSDETSFVYCDFFSSGL